MGPFLLGWERSVEVVVQCCFCLAVVDEEKCDGMWRVCWFYIRRCMQVIFADNDTNPVKSLEVKSLETSKGKGRIWSGNYTC